jgi:tetratricopeptide (TPR) repeat protein/DNA-binding SARP family transcriptional activator
VVQELLFPEATDAQGSHNLRQLLYRLRQIGAPIESDADQLSVPLELLTVDWWELLDNDVTPTSSLEHLSQGLYPGYSADVSENYREWFEVERSETSRRLRHAITAKLASLRLAGRWDTVDVAADALLALDPLSEEGTLARAEVLAISGSKTAALGVIEQYLDEVGNEQPHLRVAPAALRRRISERLPELGLRSADDRIFVGREGAMRALSTAGTAAAAGNQQILFVWGEPGIGKTRLLGEYRALAALRGVLTLAHACDSHDVYRPLGALCDLVVLLLQAPGALGCDPGARDLLQRLVSTGSNVELLRGASSHVSTLAAIILAVSELITAIACESPISILVDDSQWIDNDSLRAIVGAFSGPIARRSCLILAARDRAMLSGVDSYSDRVLSIRLNPLDDASTVQLTRRLLTPLPGEGAKRIERHVLEQSRGNPFFVRVLCSHFASTGDYDSLKQTVADILERRLEQLSPAITRVLEACVILGKNCSYHRLEVLLEIPRYELLRAVETLDDRGLIDVSESCIASSHALLSDAVMRRMSMPVQKLFHTATAEMLQRELDSCHNSRLLWDCAEHWRVAGNDCRAIELLRSVAQRALEIGRPTDALATYKRALELKAPDDVRLRIVESTLQTFFAGINFSEAEEYLCQLKKLRVAVGLPEVSHDHYEILEYAVILHSDRDPRGNVRRLRECVLAPGVTVKHKMSAAQQLLLIADLLIDAELAEFAIRETSNLAADAYDRVVADLLYHASFGDAETASDMADEVIAVIGDDSRQHVVMLLDVGYAHYRIGNCAAAREYLLKALGGARGAEMTSAEGYALLFLAQLCWSSEQFDECREWYRSLVHFMSRGDVSGIMAEYYVLGARIAMHDMQYESARDFIQRARRYPQARADRLHMQLLTSEIEVGLALTPHSCSDAQLGDLLLLHRRACTLGGQDEIVTALCNALCACGRRDQAASLLNTYARDRRKDGYLRRTNLSQLYAEFDRAGPVP